MHIAESYRKIFGVKPVKPFIADSFVAVPDGKYVLWHVDKMHVDQYDHAPITIKMLGMQVVKCGEGIKPISFRELAHAIKHAEVVISSSIISSELAGIYGKKTICLFGNRTPDTTSPYFRPDKLKILVGSATPSFRQSEDSKAINNIPPEDIANAVFELVGDKRRVTSKTVGVGNKFCAGRKLFIYPKRLPPPNARIKEAYVVVDSLSDRETVKAWKAAIDRPAVVLLSGGCDMYGFKAAIIYADEAPISAVDQCERLGIPYELVGLSVTDNLAQFCDHAVKELRPPLATEKTFFDSSAAFFDGEKEYPSLYHLKNGIEKAAPRLTIGHDTRDFRAFGDYFYVFSGPSKG